MIACKKPQQEYDDSRALAINREREKRVSDIVREKERERELEREKTS